MFISRITALISEYLWQFIYFMQFNDFLTTKIYSIFDQILNFNVKCHEIETIRGFPRAEYSKFHPFPEIRNEKSPRQSSKTEKVCLF